MTDVRECQIVIDGVRRGKVEVPVTEEGERILFFIMPEVMRRFIYKNRKYAQATSTGRWLGSRGIMPDINRKTAVLMDRIWDGKPEVDENTAEVIDDLIGHLFLLRWAMGEEMEGRR